MNCIYCNNQTDMISSSTYSIHRCYKCNLYPLYVLHGDKIATIAFHDCNMFNKISVYIHQNSISISLFDNSIYDLPLEWIFPENIDLYINRLRKLVAFS